MLWVLDLEDDSTLAAPLPPPRVRDGALWVLVGAWERQLNMKRKTDVLHKVNDDVITNVGGDVLQGL